MPHTPIGQPIDLTRKEQNLAQKTHSKNMKIILICIVNSVALTIGAYVDSMKALGNQNFAKVIFLYLNYYFNLDDCLSF